MTEIAPFYNRNFSAFAKPLHRRPIAMLTGASQNVIYFYYYDGLGSVAALSNTSGNIVEGYTYDGFGNVAIHTSAGNNNIWLDGDIGTNYDNSSNGSPYGNPYMFTGRRLDPETRGSTFSGLYYYRHRTYNPALGRFMQTDPIGYYDAMNLYQYCGNNPVNWIDPWGLKMGWGELIGHAFKGTYDGYWDEIKRGAKEGASYGLQEFQNAGSFGLYDKYGLTNASGQRSSYGTTGEVTKWTARGGVAALYAAIVLYAADAFDPALTDLSDSPKECPDDKPKPPGWNEDWEEDYGTRDKSQNKRYRDPEGGEWRRHEKDKYHDEEHWDYNPWRFWNDEWRNIDNDGNPMD